MSELNGAVTVITGGAGGVGRALALEAAKRGSRILLAEIRDASEAVQELRDAGATAEWFQVDVSDHAQMRTLAEYARSTFGEVNVLINNAVQGDGTAGALADADPDAVRRSFEVNITGYFNGIHVFAADLRSSAAGGRPAYLMNVGSEHSLGVPPYVMPVSAYTVSKYTMLAFTDVARRDFAGTGIGVSLLAPGWILTDRVREAVEQSAEFAAAVLPYAQLPAYVARAAFDGLVRHEYIIYPNPKAVPFAIEHAEAVLAELRRAELSGDGSEVAGEVWAQV